MNGKLGGAKTVVLERNVSEYVDGETDGFNRFSEAFDGLQWLLSRNQDLGLSREIEGVRWHIYVQAGDPIAKTPDIFVLFTVTDDEVIIHHIKAVEHVEESD